MRWLRRDPRRLPGSLCDETPGPAPSVVDGRPVEAGRWDPRQEAADERGRQEYERVRAEQIAEARAYDRAGAATVMYAPGSLAETLQREIAALVLERDDALAENEQLRCRLRELQGGTAQTVVMPRVRSMPAPGAAVNR